jgi:hypothetical protein
MREKWKIHRGWRKVHLAVREIVRIEVTDETVSDGTKFNSLVTQSEKNIVGGKIEEALGDDGHDRREIFNYLNEKGTQPIIKHDQKPAQNPEDRLLGLMWFER